MSEEVELLVGLFGHNCCTFCVFDGPWSSLGSPEASPPMKMGGIKDLLHNSVGAYGTESNK